ncbi:hypothetical protein IAT38_004192 [Cryptococcus sp. DSM 104549]
MPSVSDFKALFEAKGIQSSAGSTPMKPPVPPKRNARRPPPLPPPPPIPRPSLFTTSTTPPKRPVMASYILPSSKVTQGSPSAKSTPSREHDNSLQLQLSPATNCDDHEDHSEVNTRLDILEKLLKKQAEKLDDMEAVCEERLEVTRVLLRRAAQKGVTGGDD